MSMFCISMMMKDTGCQDGELVMMFEMRRMQWQRKDRLGISGVERVKVEAIVLSRVVKREGKVWTFCQHQV